MAEFAKGCCVAAAFTLCCGWGLWKAARLRARAQALSALCALVADMRQALALRGLTPRQWTAQYTGPSSFPALLAQHIEDHPEQPLARRWNDAIHDYMAADALAATLNEDDVACFRNVGAGLEAGHPLGLEDHLSYALDELTRRAAQATAEAERKRGMYLRVGVLTGLGCVILLI